jgi:phage terminase small subunit
MPITAKKQRFVDEYLVDLNATQAAIRAGYSAKTAHSQGPRLLDDVEVAKLIGVAMAKRAEATKITAERVLQELGRVALFDPRRLLNADGSPKAINELDDDTAAVLAGMDIQEEYIGTGEDRRFVGYTKKVKLADKVGALNLAMRHLGMLTDKLEVKDVTTRADRLRLARERRKSNA